MATKKKKVENIIAPVNNVAAQKQKLDKFAEIPIELIEPSAANPRKKFDDLQELTESIRSVGVLEPILVCKSPVNAEHEKLLTAKREAVEAMAAAMDKCDAEASHENSVAYARTLEKFSIVEGNLKNFEEKLDGDFRYQLMAGERRWRSASEAGLKTVPVIIKNVSPEDFLRIQILENLQRKDVSPIEEADGYANLQTSLGWTDAEIGLRVGKSAHYVQNRLKLKTLAAEVREALESNRLSLSHALEISKYPADAHNELLGLAFNNFGYVSESLYPMARFIENIQTHFLLELKKSPFSIKSKALRADGLACVDCHERTKANLLFEEVFGDKDFCQNRKCWNAKTTAHIQIQRRAVVETELKITEPEKAKKAVSKVPLISESYWLDQPKGETVLTSAKWSEISDKETCDSTEYGVFFNGTRIGQKQKICRNPKCKIHLGKYSSNGSVNKSTEDLSEERKIRKEEIFDIKVGARVRFRVLKAAAEKFEGLQDCEPDFLQEIVTKLWRLQDSYADYVLEVYAGYVAGFFGLEDKGRRSVSEVGEAMKFKIDMLVFDDLRRIAFLLLFGDRDQMFYFEERSYLSDSYKSQENIRAMAEEYEIDYRLLDAEERLFHAPMKNKDVFRDYLEEVEQGNPSAKIPRIWSTKWKPKD